jgi:methyl-accepting chemotaxis protein
MGKERSQQAYVNRTAIILFTVLTSIISVAYIVQFIKGEAGWGLFLPIEIFDLVPMILCWVVYRTNSDSQLIKHIIAVGYGLFYLILCLISTNTVLVFVYALPTVIMVSMFNDYKLSVTSGIGVSIIAIIHAVKFASMKEWEGGAVADLEIEVLIMIICSVFSIVVNRVITVINAENMDEITEAGTHTTKMLDEIMEVSGGIIDEVAIVSEKMTTLAASSEETLAAMQEIQTGTADTADSVQNQLYKTEEIQDQIDQVTEATGNIGDNVTVTDEACREGQNNIAKLMQQVQVSETAGAEVMKQVDQLKDATTKMQSIVELIQNVASQTSLLALNASIEAARAGEAGRGFAVVATEISNLSGQTQEATENISGLIASISDNVTEVVTALDSLIEGNKVQNESAHITQESFTKIVDSIGAIRDNSTNLSDIVGKLVSANHEIVESVQTISAITEEVSAHSNGTCQTTEHNERVVEEVLGIVEEMTKKAEQLKAMR